MGNDKSVPIDHIDDHDDDDEDFNHDEDFKWPDNLYVETWDMAAISFLVYAFGQALDAIAGDDDESVISDVTRDDETKVTIASVTPTVSTVPKNISSKSLVGPTQDQSNEDNHSNLSRSEQILKQENITPSEVKELIEENLESLKKKYPDVFDDPTSRNLMDQCFKRLIESAEQTKLKRPITIKSYCYEYREREMIYCICKDSINKRITVVFRGCDKADMAHWVGNMKTTKKAHTPLPSSLKGKINGDKIWFHAGFYDYLFDKAYNPNEDENMTNYDSLLVQLSLVMQKFPSYKVYTTGHSLGGALSSIAALFLASTPGALLPKPITCINFASPRVGDHKFLDAVQVLEQNGALRLLRIVNENDSLATVPTVNYNHAGFQLVLFEGNHDPKLTYPKLQDTFMNRFSRAYQNSSLNATWNFTYNQREYRERIEKDRESLEKYDLNHMYDNKDLTGFT